METGPRIVGHGSTAIVSTVDDKTVLKGYEVWSKDRLRAKCAESSEDRLVREDIIYRHLGSHPLILQSFGLKEIRPGVHSLCLEMAPLGCVRLQTQSTLSPVNLPLPKLRDPPLIARLRIVKQELFAFGVAIYEITTWRRPFDNLGEDSCEVDIKYAQEEFPLLEPDNPAKDVIKGCWMEKFDTADQVVSKLEHCLGLTTCDNIAYPRH